MNKSFPMWRKLLINEHMFVRTNHITREISIFSQLDLSKLFLSAARTSDVVRGYIKDISTICNRSPSSVPKVQFWNKCNCTRLGKPLEMESVKIIS